MNNENMLSEWRLRALRFESALHEVIVGQRRPIRLMVIAAFARGHVLLEGDVGVGKTTLLRAFARGLGGSYERMEGTIDLMPADLLYHTFINDQGRPCVEPGPLLRWGPELSTFFFNEINRARPQVHSTLLRVMAERSVTAFNRDYHFPHLLVFADRNRVEREETFELPAAARDRFLMEIAIEAPTDIASQKMLMFDTRFHDVDTLIEPIQAGVVPFAELNAFSATLQNAIHISDALKDYVIGLWNATRHPNRNGIELPGVDMDTLVIAGGSPRGMSYLIRAARVHAWLNDRSMVVPEDVQGVFSEVVAHRVFLSPVYELRRASIMRELIASAIKAIPAP